MTDRDLADAIWAADALAAMLERVRKMCMLEWLRRATELGPQ
jgi:hypothetical protein